MSVGRITVDTIEVVELEVDPIGVGVSAPIGSIGSKNDGTGIYYKTGVNDTDWTLALLSPSNKFYYAKDDTESSTTSKTTYIQKLNLTVNNLPSGTYVFSACFGIRSSAGNTSIQIQLLDNSVEVENATYTLSNTTDQPHYGAFDVMVTSGTHSFDLKFRAVGTGAITVYIHKVLLSLEKKNV